MPPFKYATDKDTVITKDALFLFQVPAAPSTPLDNIRVMVIVWRLRGNIRTALCWIVRHSVHSLQHTYVSSSYRSNRLGLSRWDLIHCA